MNATRATAALTLILALPLAGCGDDDHQGGDDGPRSPAAGVEVEVLAEGAQPRKMLRVGVEDGQRETTTMTMEQTIDHGAPTEAPPITLTFTTEVLEAGEDEIETEIVYGPAHVSPGDADPSMVSDVQAALDPIEGLTGTVVQSTSGQVLEAAFDIPDDVPDTMATLIEQFSDQASGLAVPFPDAAVGVGARWAATTTFDSNGAEVEQVATYTLDAFGGNTYEMSVQIEQAFQPGEVDGFEITGGSGTGSGRIQGSLDGLAPTTSTVEYQNSITGQGDGETIDVRTSTEMRLRSDRS